MRRRVPVRGGGRGDRLHDPSVRPLVLPVHEPPAVPVAVSHASEE